ncbi:MAG: lamin tail domain-containing protein [Anaerolineae bacterium]|nr:lamin tail domain-containing protein [Anaerolineae bacterium]
MYIKQFQRIIFWLVLLVIVLFNLNQLVAKPNGEISSPLIITEFMAANRSGHADEDGDFSDWIEIHNQSNEPVNLSGWTLTDDANQPEKWTFPEITLPAHTYLTMFASGKDRKPIDPNLPLHTNFRLSRDGGVLALYNPTVHRFSDAVIITYPPQFSDVSYGRVHSETSGGVTYGYYATSTPSETNPATPTWIEQTARVNFSAERGFYQTPFAVALTCDTPEAVIRYTTDGSEPTETHGILYTTPIPISQTTLLRAVALKPNFLPSAVDTHTYIFLADVLAQPVTQPQFLTDWGSYPKDIDGNLANSPVQPDFEMDPEIVNHRQYRTVITQALTSIPTLSLVTAPKNYDIYAHPQERGVEWERPVSVEFIYPHGERKAVQVNAGLRIQGGKGRREDDLKHSFRLFFKDDYGSTEFKYPLFPDSPVDTFNTLVLRGGVNGSYAGRQPELLATYTRDEWLRTSQIEMSGVGSHGIFVHLYLNGLYWGLYNAVERPDAAFAASYYGGQEEEWHVRNHNGQVGGDAFYTEGTRYNFITAKTPAEKYAAIAPFIDFSQFSDYIILNWYGGNVDWATKNFYFAVQNPDGKAKYFAWDGEKIWLSGASLYFYHEKPNFDIEAFFDALIWQPDFKMLFADRMYKNLFNDGPLTDENSLARWNTINDEIELAIIGESARWGDAKRETPYTRDDWLVLRQEVASQMENNAAKLIALAREAGYYPPLDPPAFSQRSGSISAEFPLALVADPPNTIYYTVDGSDPRLPGGDISRTAQQYRSPFTLSTNTVIKARTYRNGIWSALNEANFSVRQPGQNLVITEIMYNPIDGDDYEFIELKNIGPTHLDLSNATFEGIRYTFPVGSRLVPGQVIVLARNEQAFAERYPGLVPFDFYAKNLSNQGETITLKKPQGDVIISLTYDDENGWPLSADGHGDSAELLDPVGDLNDPQNWRASQNLYGSPGTTHENFMAAQAKP